MRRIPVLLQAIAVLAGAWLLFVYAFPPVMPRSLLWQFLAITALTLLLYYSSDDARWQALTAPLKRLKSERKLWPLRWTLILAASVAAGYAGYEGLKPSALSPPPDLRQVHPAPPSMLAAYSKSYDLATLENPLRREVVEGMKSDPTAAWETYRGYVAEGRDVYYQNCFYCHGDLLDGKGHYAQGLNPLPTDFQDVGTIAQLQESFLFWRIATGGTGLPGEGAPWNSAMPAWGGVLSEDEAWKVILFLYDYIGQVPRLWDAELSRAASAMKEQIESERRALMGIELYRFRCAMCHGDEGKGDGVAADYLYPKPADFSLAQFKYTFSPVGRPPLDDDLFLIIKMGLTGTGMPGFRRQLSDQQIQSLIPVIKGFDTSGTWAPEDADSDAFDDEGRYTGKDFVKVTEREPVADKVPFSQKSVAKGKVVYEKTCVKCHGEAGRGNITSGKRLESDAGERLWPRDLTQPWTWRATNIPGPPQYVRDVTIDKIYSRLTIGMPGTPMPANRATEEGAADPINREDRWHLANFIYTLREQSVAPVRDPLIQAHGIGGELPTALDAKEWAEAPAATLRLVPNLIQGERLFKPLNEAVTVRALYNDREIAFLLEVHDHTDSRPGEPVSTQIHDARLPMHSDAFAIQLPKEGAFAAQAPVAKPRLAHGDTGRATTLWYWNAGAVELPAPVRTALLDATGAAPQPRAGGDLSAAGRWQNGRWRVLMKRPRQGTDGDVAFLDGRYIPIAFANWDGNNGEIGSKHTLTAWSWLVLPAEVSPLRLYGIPAGLALLALLVGAGLLRRRD